MKKGKHYRRTSVRNNARNRSIKKKSVSLFTVVIVITLAVFLGFMTTKFVIYPLILGQEASFDVVIESLFADAEKDDEEKADIDIASDSAVSADTSTSTDTESKQDTDTDTDTDKTTVTSGYSIQFGAFSSRASAEELIDELKNSGISADIIEKDGVYKVIGPLFSTKDEAIASRNNITSIDQEKYKDVFIISI